MEDILVKIQEWLALYGIKVIAALVILIVGRWVAKAIRGLLRRFMTKRNVDETLIPFLCDITYVGLIVFVWIAALSQLGIQTTSLIAVLGAAGLAVALALQGSLANFAAGVLMIIFKPFKVGDYIEAGGTAGTVASIGIFATTLNSPDNRKIIVPNSKMSGDNIVNYTAHPTRRVDLVAGVSYSDDLNKVREVLNSILAEDDRVLKDPAPVVAVLELGDSSINFVVRPWVNTENYWAAYFDLQKKIKERFDAEGISIPFPQRDVHMIPETGSA